MTTANQLRTFLRFPWKILSADPAWVPPLLFDHKTRFKKNNPFFEHGEVQSWLALDQSGVPVGRISAVVNRLHNEFHSDNVGFFGFFDCINDQAVATALLDVAAAYLKQKGLTSIRGPVNFSTNDECGMLVEGFDTPPAVLMTHNPPYYNTLVEQAGFVKAKDILAYEMHIGEISDRVIKLGEKIEARLKIKIRPFNPKQFWSEVDRIEEVYNKAWESNWGFVPMTRAELKLMAQMLKLGYDPRVIFFAENEAGKPVGFSLALPDLHVLQKKINGRLFPTGLITLLAQKKKINRLRVLSMGVVPEYRLRGIDIAFYCRTYLDGTKAGYNWGEFSWILEDNHNMNQAAISMGSKPYKRWRFWERQIS